MLRHAHSVAQPADILLPSGSRSRRSRPSPHARRRITIAPRGGSQQGRR